MSPSKTIKRQIASPHTPQLSIRLEAEATIAGCVVHPQPALIPSHFNPRKPAAVPSSKPCLTVSFGYYNADSRTEIETTHDPHRKKGRKKCEIRGMHQRGIEPRLTLALLRKKLHVIAWRVKELRGWGGGRPHGNARGGCGTPGEGDGCEGERCEEVRGRFHADGGEGPTELRHNPPPHNLTPADIRMQRCGGHGGAGEGASGSGPAASAVMRQHTDGAGGCVLLASHHHLVHFKASLGSGIALHRPGGFSPFGPGANVRETGCLLRSKS
ncbi:hypothetical protein DFH06DRAFT_1123452 [Mycena polygramma]|nr:hypothetical protein DFH06DRAFT_1123452 [Mycena polygramma]